MTDSEQYRLELVGEVKRIHNLLSEASNRDLEAASACSGWTVLDVGRHVEITPRSVAANIEAHLGGRQPPATTQLSPDAGHTQVLDALLDGADLLDGSLARLVDDNLDDMLPGPAGPMPGRAALDLALTELTLHRCDIELGLGLTPQIDDAVTQRLIDVMQAWLLLTAPSELVPDQPWCVELRGHTRSWFFFFDGSRWSDSECRTGEVVGIDTAARAILALAGREPLTPSASGPISRLKTYLPGP